MANPAVIWHGDAGVFVTYFVPSIHWCAHKSCEETTAGLAID
jgi:hypothetical protein